MRKYICTLGLVLILTGCFTSAGLTDIIDLEDLNNLEATKEKRVYIRDDVKQVIEEINSIREKYDDGSGRYVYINIYEDNKDRVEEVEFNNRYIPIDEHFNELVQVLDKDLAKGLKAYVDEIKVKELKIDEPIVKKIGGAVVYSENRWEDEDNYISITMKFSEIEDEHYGAIFNNISDGKYILDNIILGEKLNLIDIGNPNIVYDRRGPNISDTSIIRYNIFFQDKDIEKVNILIQGKKGSKFKDEDIDVFINLLNNLELKGKDKDLLIDEYKNIFENKSNKKISLSNYNVLIKSNKGNTYGGRDRQLIYFSIERK